MNIREKILKGIVYILVAVYTHNSQHFAFFRARMGVCEPVKGVLVKDFRALRTAQCF